ncbi:disease resistance RPP13-like protein 4 [Pyrus communis]|uniref:disease resistance RPP13-like protein 4 n=1 Tax=Pyrus communis TaxID=23211 RepID=UPI0035C1461E
MSTPNSSENPNEILSLERIRETIIPSLLAQFSSAIVYLSASHFEMANQFEKLRKDLTYIQHAFTGLKNFEESASNLFKILQQAQHSLRHLLYQQSTRSHILDSQAKQFQPKLQVLNETIIKLKLLLPSPHKLLLSKEKSLLSTGIESHHPNKVLDKLSGLHFSKVFEESPAYKEFQVVYNSLRVTTKLCLLCFAVFPVNEVVKKRVLIQWWVGEGFVNPPVGGKETVLEIADGIFEEITKKGCVEPVNKKRRPSVVHSFKMNPIIRSAVIVIAKEVGFFGFDNKGNPTTEFSWSRRACLMNGSQHLMQVRAHGDPENLQTIFNVNESYPDFSKVEWSKLRNVNVLYLGRWHNRAKHHIEVDDTEFFHGLQYLVKLIFFSLRGISRIMELPDSVCKLVSLRILDLSTCHNLEVLPERIGLLKNLTHLDMSECYLLEHMPKGIALLSELQVLKGFIIREYHKNDTPCTLQDLSALQKLRKLTISTSREDFPSKQELIDFQHLKSLRKLTIVWGGLSIQANAAPELGGPTGTKTHIQENREYFEELEKMDLQCYPRMTAPSWLVPGRPKSLKKLYVRGGPLRNLGHAEENDKWTVEILRLKFLSELKMDWNELQMSFPHLTYVEKFRCPRLTFFPCDESGVWLKPRNGTNEIISAVVAISKEWICRSNFSSSYDSIVLSTSSGIVEQELSEELLGNADK